MGGGGAGKEGLRKYAWATERAGVGYGSGIRWKAKLGYTIRGGVTE